MGNALNLSFSFLTFILEALFRHLEFRIICLPSITSFRGSTAFFLTAMQRFILSAFLRPDIRQCLGFHETSLKASRGTNNWHCFISPLLRNTEINSFMAWTAVIVLFEFEIYLASNYQSDTISCSLD